MVVSEGSSLQVILSNLQKAFRGVTAVPVTGRLELLSSVSLSLSPSVRLCVCLVWSAFVFCMLCWKWAEAFHARRHPRAISKYFWSTASCSLYEWIYITSLYESFYMNCTPHLLFERVSKWIWPVAAYTIVSPPSSVVFPFCMLVLSIFECESRLMHGILFIPDGCRKLSSQIQMLKAHHSQPIFIEWLHTLFVVSSTICFYMPTPVLLIA